MRVLSYFVAAFPLAVVIAVPQLPVSTGKRASCSKLGDVQCSSDGSHVQLCDGSESLQIYHWKDIEDCGEPNGCHSRGPQNRAYCIIKHPTQSTHLGNIPTDLAVPDVESRDEALTRDSTRCHDTGALQCSSDRSKVQECTSHFLWKDTQDCFQPGCCHEDRMFTSGPACFCPGTLTTIVKDKATPTVAPRDETPVVQSEPSSIAVTSECISGQLLCDVNGQDLWICVNGHWNFNRHCTICKVINGQIACMGNGLPAPSIEDTPSIVARAESLATNAECVDGQQRCGANAQGLYICLNGSWSLEYHCPECTEENGIVACRNKLSTRSGSCIPGHSQCNRDGHTIDKCKNGSWVFWDNCHDFGRGCCIPDGTTTYCEGPLIGGRLAAAHALIPRIAGSETSVPVATTSGADEASAPILSPELSCTENQLRCSSDRKSVEKCQNRAWKLDRKCSNDFGRHCVSSHNTAYCGYTNKATDLVPTPIQEKRNDAVFSPHGEGGGGGGEA